MTDRLILIWLANALWQVPLLTGAAWVADWVIRRSLARWRHLIWVAALMLSVLMPLASLRLTGAGPNTGQTVSVPPPIASLFALAYSLILAFGALRLLWAGVRVYRLLREARQCSLADPLLSLAADCEARLELTPVRILCSPNVAGPLTIASVVILPESLLRNPSPTVWMAAIGHEMAHVRRRDFARNLMLELLHLPVAFHPAAAFLKSRLQQTRELACDEIVAQRLVDPRSYAEALVALAGASQSPRLAFGVSDGGKLEDRIKRLLGPRPAAQPGRLVVALLVLIAATVGAAVWWVAPVPGDPPPQITVRIQPPSPPPPPPPGARMRPSKGK